MELQISSGRGPEECELATSKFLRVLEVEYLGIKVLERYCGRRADCLRSVRLESAVDLSFLDGSVQWICQSPYRPKHKRKNWFIDISICGSARPQEFDDTFVRFETFRSGGKGGQHVNKVETGVRAVYIPTGQAVVSTEARSQHMNKKIALDRLCTLLASQNAQDYAQVRTINWLEHTRLVRGNPVRVYSGMEFKRIK